MTWSHNDMWMLTADHGGYVKYWQSNMNNVKMFQAHKEAIREARFIPNLPFSVVQAGPRCWLSATRGRWHMFCLLCMCVLLQHCSDLLLIFFLMWLKSRLCTPTLDVLNKVIISNRFGSATGLGRRQEINKDPEPIKFEQGSINKESHCCRYEPAPTGSWLCLNKDLNSTCAPECSYTFRDAAGPHPHLPCTE